MAAPHNTSLFHWTILKQRIQMLKYVIAFILDLQNESVIEFMKFHI